MLNHQQSGCIYGSLKVLGFGVVESENPYWAEGFFTIEDSDGWRDVLMNTSGI
ncbi:hypothetical protein [Viridibacillus soli]|uniref:hypothetical protein n=1 Tax=Viridibacillus soli TaxID=2798301 RepID=UPI00389A5BC9